MASVSTSDSLQVVLNSPEFVEITDSDFFKIDLKYAADDNFMNENVYLDFRRAFLHEFASKKLSEAAKNLKKINPSYKFVIYDGLRPRSVQWKMWNKVKGTDHQQYIANPESGSNHNFGMAVDLSILDEKGYILDMGTGFDEFDERSQPKHEERFFAEKKLTEKHLANRKILRDCMEAAGFKQLSTEWWHFDALPRAEIRANYKIVE
ncbi:MAG: M15 family metallopeptidase [Pseudobdellovibrio sp.]